MRAPSPKQRFRHAYVWSTPKVRRLRAAKRVTGAQVASSAGIDRERYFQIESGERPAKVGEGFRIARALRVRISDLLALRRVPIAS